MTSNISFFVFETVFGTIMMEAVCINKVLLSL